MHKIEHFQVGDKVRVHPEGLKRHSKSVPAHAGFTTEQFAWRKILSDLQDENAIGTVERVFPGPSGSLNVRFGKSLLGVSKRMVEKVHDNPKKSRRKKLKRTRKRNPNISLRTFPPDTPSYQYLSGAKVRALLKKHKIYVKLPRPGYEAVVVLSNVEAEVYGVKEIRVTHYPKGYTITTMKR